MDWEKKYKDAETEMRLFVLPTMKEGIAKQAVERAFPNLAESEDERISKWLINVIEEVKTDDDWCADLNKCNEAISWIEKQKEQKPAEWSEEDKEMKLKILKYLSTRCSVIEFEEVENWLNNLRIRPHWKPSEEQLDALREYIYAKQPNTDKYGKPVVSLLSDLKQL